MTIKVYRDVPFGWEDHFYLTVDADWVDHGDIVKSAGNSFAFKVHNPWYYKLARWFGFKITVRGYEI